MVEDANALILTFGSCRLGVRNLMILLFSEIYFEIAAIETGNSGEFMFEENQYVLYSS